MLHGLPLAIESAGAALGAGKTLQRIFNLLSDDAQHSRILRDTKPSTSDWAYSRNKPIYIVLEETIEHLAQEHPFAPLVLAWIALLGPGEIPRYALAPFGTSSDLRPDSSQNI